MAGGAMARLGTALIIVGSLALAAALMAYAGPGLREIGFVLVTGVTSPRGALVGGAVLVAAGVALRRRAQRGR